jgi:glycosyltransferase 2 family protein
MVIFNHRILMNPTSKEILKNLSPGRIIIPVMIGMGIVSYLIYNEWNRHAISALNFNWFMLFFILFSFLMMALRDIGYMIRLRILLDGDITWRQGFNIIMLWEFASAVTPSAVGGTSVATYFIYKEGINFGRSTAVVMATAFLDELYFLLMFPIMIIVVGTSSLFFINNSLDGSIYAWFDNKYFYFALIGYGFKFIFDLFLAYGLFVNPRFVKSLLMTIFRLPFLTRWSQRAEKAGNDLVTSSGLLKEKSPLFWLKAMSATFISWTARYWVVNLLILALVFGLPTVNNGTYLSISEHLIIFARQLVMWIMMLVMPSPGGSGFAEAIFSDYLRAFIPLGFVAIMAFLWRIVSYYPYLLMGAFVLPRWIKRVHRN